MRTGYGLRVAGYGRTLAAALIAIGSFALLVAAVVGGAD